MSLKHLSESRDLKDFFSNLKKLDLINYHPSYDLDQLRSLGRDHGWLIEYCGPETNQYKKYGHYICKVVSVLSDNQKMLDPIDVKTVATDFDKTWVKKRKLSKFMK